MGKPASKETSRHRPNIPEGVKGNWALGGYGRAESVCEFGRAQRPMLHSFEKIGPSGPTYPLLPIDINRAYEALNSATGADTFSCGCFIMTPNNSPPPLYEYRAVSRAYLNYHPYVEVFAPTMIPSCFLNYRRRITYRNG